MYYCPNCRTKTLIISSDKINRYVLNCSKCNMNFYVSNIGKYVRKMRGIKYDERSV